MQVVMTSNHALLSNRLYQHQQLPYERADHTNDLSRQISNGMNKQFTISEEHMTNGIVPRQFQNNLRWRSNKSEIALSMRKQREALFEVSLFHLLVIVEAFATFLAIHA